MFLSKLFKKIIIISLCCLSFACAKKVEDKLANLTPEQLYSDGMIYLKKEEYKESIKYFERINQEYPDNQHALILIPDKDSVTVP